MEDKINYFIDKTDDRLQRIEAKLDEVIKFKWQILGGTAVLSFVISSLIALFLK